MFHRNAASAVLRVAALLAGIALGPVHGSTHAAPPGFVVEDRGSGWTEVVGTTFLPNGNAAVWERSGRVWLVTPSGTKLPSPLLDISDEVGAWRDYGLLCVALHPDFASNGWLYCFYVVDRHHLDFAGTPSYSPTSNAYYAATIGRLTRYTARADTGYTQVDPASRLVLLGESATTGVPIVHQSHGLGSLLFGTDGTLLLCTGDAASYVQIDVGGQVTDGYVSDALDRGILRSKENVGAWRAQLIDCLNGKVLRINPATGDGVPSNPFFDPANPRAPRSRVYAMGLRNPFRATIVAGTGSHDPQDADPGTLHIGDVGWNINESLYACTGAGQNFGWPAFEGLSPHAAYQASAPLNTDAPTGLASPAFYRFHELVREVSQDATASLALDAARFVQAELGSGSSAPVATDFGGFHGSGYRDFGAGSGAWIDMQHSVASAGAYTLIVRYANGSANNRPLRVSVDGAVAVASVDFPPTGSWSEWRLVSVPLTLAAGNRTVRMETIGSNGANIDGQAVVPAGASPPLLAAAGVWNEHRRPSIDWAHATGVARTPAFTNGAASTVAVGAAGGASGTSFGGSCAIGGPRVHDHKGDWPAPWNDCLFFGDFSAGWIRALTLSAAGSVDAVHTFDESMTALTSIAHNPLDGSLWTTQWGTIVRRFRYAPQSGQAPEAVLTATPAFGPSPLSVTLSAAQSTDPEGQALTYFWDFGDGTPPAYGSATVVHSFVAPGGTPARFDPAVTVRDPLGNFDTATIVVSPNNTPPTANIISLYDGQPYSMSGDETLPLRAQVGDAESAGSGLSCAWVAVLHHNTHEHSEPPDPACETIATTSPLGCDGESYSFEFRLTVTDPFGLSSQDSVTLFPDCNGWLECPADLSRDGLVNAADLTLMLAGWGQPGPTDLNHSGMTDASDLTVLLSAWGPCS